MTKTELIEEIKNRFSQVPYPGDNDLTIHPLGLDEIFYDAIRGKTWQELDTEMLTYHHDCIGVLTTKGFQYYLPAFLIADIQKEQAIFEYLLYWLSNCQNRAGSPIKNVSGTDWLTMRINIEILLLSKLQYNHDGKLAFQYLIPATFFLVSHHKIFHPNREDEL
jgi:hypothetical protein